MTKAYAVVDEYGKIIIPTVMDTERGAMVNWLARYAGYPIPANLPDKNISELFLHETKGTNTMVREVHISIDPVIRLGD